MYAHNGQTDLAAELSFEVDDLLPLVDAAVMLTMLEVQGAQAFLTDTGHQWYTADIHTSKQHFARLSLQHAPLVRTIAKALENSHDGALREDFFRDLLRRGFSAEDTEKQLDLAIDWGRYGELFDYDADTGELISSEIAGEIGSQLAKPLTWPDSTMSTMRVHPNAKRHRSAAGRAGSCR